MNRNYYPKRIFIEGLTVGADFYINYDSESIPSNDSSACIMFGFRNRSSFILVTFRNLAENIIRMSNVKFPPGSEATEEVARN